MKFNQHFTYKKIITAVLPPIIMMLFTSLYSVVDGIFLSNFAGKEAFAAVGFIMPYLMIFNSVGFMFGTGGSALIAKMLGEKHDEEANETFSSLILVSLLTGILLMFIGEYFIKGIAVWQGAEGSLLENALIYGRIYLLGTPLCLIQFEFQALYQTSGKGNLGLKATIISGFANILLDAIFLSIFTLGTKGAAYATVISQWLGGLIPIIYFSQQNNSPLRFIKCKIKMNNLLKICANGSSEMVNNLSISIVSMFYNIQLIKYGGSNAIAAYGIMNYVNFMFTAVFWGYISGIAPIISYQYGAKNKLELSNLLSKSLVNIFVCSTVMFLISEILAYPIALIYARRETELMSISVHGLRLFAINFLFAGFSIFLSSFFTALNNGLISAMISFCRVFVFQIPSVFILPQFLKLDGIWLSVGIAEVMTVILGILLLLKHRPYYH